MRTELVEGARELGGKKGLQFWLQFWSVGDSPLSLIKQKDVKSGGSQRKIGRTRKGTELAIFHVTQDDNGLMACQWIRLENRLIFNGFEKAEK